MDVFQAKKALLPILLNKMSCPVPTVKRFLRNALLTSSFCLEKIAVVMYFFHM